MDRVRRLRGELCGDPVRVAVPHAPRHRGVGFGQLLKHRDAVHWRQVEPAIGRRQENAKKTGACEIAREILRQPAGCFDNFALRDNTRLEVAGSCKKGSAVRRIVHRYPPNPAVKLVVRRRGTVRARQTCFCWLPDYGKHSHISVLMGIVC